MHFKSDFIQNPRYIQFSNTPMFHCSFISFLIFLFSGVAFSQQKNYTHLKVPDSSVQQFLLSDEVKETSGLIFWKGLLWTHNDDHDNKLYGINPFSGIIEQQISIENLKVTDWEDLQHDEHYFYIGDIGNNAKGNRNNLRIFRKKKTSDQLDTITFHYPEQINFAVQKANTTNFDCEAFIVTDSTIYLFTKEWRSKKTSLYKIPNIPGRHKAQFIDTFSFQGLITGAALNEKRQLIVLTGYTKTLNPFIYLLYNFYEDNYLSGSKLKLKISNNILQIEAVTFLDDSTIAITNEQFNHSLIKSPQKLTIIDLRHFLK